MERDPMEMALSTDIVLDIVLSHLEAKDLLDCRYVSKFWNKAASSALRKRSTMIKDISKENQLMELQDCMDQSSDFPFAGLRFYEPWRLNSAGAMKFFRNYGTRFTRLFLGTEWWEARLENQAPFLNHLSRLSVLQLGWSQDNAEHAELLDSAAGQEAGKALKLPTLRTLRLSSCVSEDVLRAVFTAASPSLRIECLQTSYEMLKELKSAGKLQDVAIMHVYQDEDEEDEEEDDALTVDQLLSTQTPTLKELDFDVGGCISRNGLMKLLISSQKTLKKLRLNGIVPSELSEDCPVLVKLTALSLYLVPSTQYLFQEGQGHKFPALKEMEIDMEDDIGIPQVTNGSFIVPSLTTLNLLGYVNKEGIEDLARRFPNVIELQLKHQTDNLELAREADPYEIWSVGAFQFLEKLVIRPYTIQSPTKIFDNLKDSIHLKKLKLMNIDSLLTGIPITICENLRKQPQQNLMNSPLNEILRDGPSLLQLKNLKEFIVCVRLDDALKKLPEEPAFISMVSVWYALEMMLNLRWKFVYEDGWVKRHQEQTTTDKEVKMLKAAFKHVQPHVELEPFFY